MGVRLLLIALIATTIIHESWTCDESQFQCNNGTCISKNWQCDSADDCGDGSDEDPNICDKRPCLITEFQCDVGKCIPKRWQCDGDNDCSDGSDENPNICHKGKCLAKHFECDNHKCITKRFQCDSDNDCGDMSDQDPFICHNRTCLATEIRCNNGKCIPMSLLCNSEDDCGDGTDENPNNCRNRETTPTSHVLITPETITTLPHTTAQDLLSTSFSRGSIPEAPPLIYDVTTIYRLAEPLPSATETRGVNVQGALNHPGTVEVHARTNARGLPFRLKDGTIRGPNVGVSVPDCLQETQNCSWTPKNFTMTKLFSNTMPLLKFGAIENFVLKSSQYTEAQPFQSALRFTFDTTRENSGCNERCYMSVFLIAQGGNVTKDDMYYLRIRHLSDSHAYLTKCTAHTTNGIFYITNDKSRRCDKKEEVDFEWNFKPETSFTVSVTNGRIVLMASRLKGHITLFDWTDSDPIAITNVVFSLNRLEGIVRSATDVYPFLELTEETGTITSPSLSPGLDKLCVSVVFYTDKEANIEMQLQHDNSLSTVWELNSGQQSLTQNSVWAHKNILVNIPSGTIGEMAVVIRATKRVGSTVLIQMVAGCNAQEQEDVLVLSEEALITVTSPGIDIAHNFIYKNAEKNICNNGGLNLIEERYNLATQQGACSCPAGFTGNNCEIACGANSYGSDCEGVCSESERECQGMVLCRPEIGCNCAPGYKGLHCITPCEEGEHGAGCHQTCGNCANSSCDVYTGVCHQGCMDGHYPPFCKEVYAHITRTPWVVVNSFHNASVSADLINLNGQGEPRYYQVQFKEENACEWQLKEPQPIPVKTPEKLLTLSLTQNVVSLGHVNDLKPGTPYLLRVVLIDKSSAIYQRERVPSASFSTPCTVPNKADYILHNKNLGFLDIVAVNDDGFEIGWQIPTETTTWCPVIGYEVNVKMGWQWKVYKVPADITSLQVRKLLPGRKYTVKVRAVTSRGPAAFSQPHTVTTLDRAPDYVVDLKEGEITEHSVTVTWSPPRQSAGTLHRYHVTYQCLRLMGCPQEDCSSSADHIEVMTTSVLLDGLLPHAKYTISVAGESGALGPASSLITATIPGAPDVAPLFARPAVLSRSNTSLTVQWAPPVNCARLNGYLRGYRYELVTPEQQLPLLVGTTTNYSATFNNLKPNTDYMVRVFVESTTGWNKAYGLEIASKTRDTRSEVVKNLTVYKRGRRMVGLRWSPPGRTYGSLQSFTITHKPLTGSGKPISVTVKPSLCPAWNQLYCHTINNLKPDTEYTITVQALNSKSTKSSEEASNEIITRIVHDEGASIAEHDILIAIKIPFDDPKTQFFDDGIEGFPAFGLKPGSDVKSPYRLFLPEKFYGEFSIYATIHTKSSESAFLFSVVNPLETVVQLGVQISPAGAHQPNNMNISLIYTDVNSHLPSQTIASFTVPSFVNKWTRFALKVTKEYVTLFLNCKELGTVVLKRTPQELVFESLSLLYVGQAGPLIKEAFDGALQELKIFGSASVAHLQCGKSVFKEEPDSTDATEVGEEVTINATTKESAPEAPSYLRVKNQTDVSLAVEWGLPDMINGNLRSFLVNIEETDSVNSSDCCAYFPIREIMVNSEHSVYEFQTTGLKPASSYEVSVSAKTVAMGPALTLTGHTRPPTPVLSRAPRVTEPVVVGKPLVVQVEPNTDYPDQLISGYLLLLEEIGQSDYAKPIQSESLLTELKVTPNKSFALLAEFTQSELPDGGKFEIQPDRPMVKGRFGLMGLPLMKPGSQYRLIWALVLDYCGAQSVGHVIGDIFTADLP